MQYISGDIKHAKCCSDPVYFTAVGSYISCPTLKAKLYYQVQCQDKDRDQESWECLFPAVLLVQGDPQIPSAAAVRGEMSKMPPHSQAEAAAPW